MKDHLKVTLVQSHLFWENPEANRTHFSNLFEKIVEETDLIILPEMFTSGFTMNAIAVAEAPNGPSVLWMISEAKKKKAAITGSLIIEEEGVYYNRLFFVRPDGAIETYDKKHTFTLAGEHKIFKAGNSLKQIEYKGWKIRPLVCYDLRFPVWARNTDHYDIILYVANWPERRVAAWDALLKARAIENMAYSIGVNRTGLDGNGHQYTGHSAVYDVLGKHISTASFENEFIDTITLEKAHIEKNRKHLQFLNDADSFNLV